MNWADRARPIQVGDTVAYSAVFLRGIGCVSGDMPQAKGKVTALVPIGKEVLLAEINRDLPDLPARQREKPGARTRHRLRNLAPSAPLILQHRLGFSQRLGRPGA